MKAKLIALGLAAAMAVACSSASAQATTMGARSCGLWVKHRSEKSISEAAARSWLVGYLSGLAVASNIDTLKNAESESLFLWVDNYCKTNPLKSIGEAGLELHFELATGKK